MFDIEFKKQGAITVATVQANQVTGTFGVTDLGDEIIAFLEDHPDTHLLVSFEKVHFLSSSILTEFLRINDTIRKSNASMRICGLSDEMKKVFALTRLDEILRIEDDYKTSLRQYHNDVQPRP